jgi:hypothetical protein
MTCCALVRLGSQRRLHPGHATCQWASQAHNRKGGGLGEVEMQQASGADVRAVNGRDLGRVWIPR